MGQRMQTYFFWIQSPTRPKWLTLTLRTVNRMPYMLVVVSLYTWWSVASLLLVLSTCEDVWWTVLRIISSELSLWWRLMNCSYEYVQWSVHVRISIELSDTGSLGSMEVCADSDSGHGSCTSSTFDPHHHPPRPLGPTSRHQSQSSLQHTPLSCHPPGK